MTGEESAGQELMNVIAEFEEKTQLFAIMGKVARGHGAPIDGKHADTAAARAATAVV